MDGGFWESDRKSECSEDYPLEYHEEDVYNESMFLRRIRRKKNGENYDYWALVECVRTGRGPRQWMVATI